ncbi:CPBP family intramembrane glutamic endopeptidase [uncultured Polaribacter sp.]|uniref:CPBP family intramembrane glutamic endopeptidase n=1 Tax=uncultured Polaribacter sp. TaxID=174711 RepID=UPI002614F330|nr:CPBP family intramembrane glutamic endopeptidase [uncultured Polaribacter sp.]
MLFIAILDGLQREYKIWENEKLIYQILMPSLDEEIAYRGVLIGLFSTILNKKKTIFLSKINPVILVTSILFGLIHSLKIEINLDFYFNSYVFVKTFFYGFIWGWIAIKTKSLLLPILFHSVSNVLPFLVTYLK